MKLIYFYLVALVLIFLAKKHKSKSARNDEASNTATDSAVEELEGEWPTPGSVLHFTPPEIFTNAADGGGNDVGNEEVLYSLNNYYRYMCFPLYLCLSKAGRMFKLI